MTVYWKQYAAISINVTIMAKTQENTDNNAQNSTEKLKKENEQLRELLKEALSEIQNLNECLNKYEKPNDGYNKSWSVVAKIVFIITKADKPLRSSEIIPLLQIREPSIVNKQSSLEKYVSAFLNTAMKHERLIPYKLKGVRGNYYCIPEWMDEQGELIPDMRRKIY
jgi:sugar-specific transcriptional regulator TrmB